MTKRILLLSTAALLSLTPACTPKQKSTAAKHTSLKRADKKGLSFEISEERKAALSNPHYKFEIDLTKASTEDFYTGHSLVTFDFEKKKFKSEHLSLDFEAGEVLEVSINGKKIEDSTYNTHFLSLPINHFKEGSNTIKVAFSRKYSKTGSGLYKFTDKTDNNTFVYTDFEPYDANQFAPLFDQPNLKAHYSLIVKAPKKWTIISSVKEQFAKESRAIKTWSFPKSQKFSTYIFSLHGGPYKVWSGQVMLKSKKIDLRLFARPSLAKFVKPKFWFKITKQGFNFFEQYFSTEYPYTKYDQVLVPDFNSGAMENVAAVTFNEAYVSREAQAPRAQRRRLANVIFHEMAHMWFGNLVTMDWWNDLWLNESFATFMANAGLFYNTDYTETWISFYSRRKQWAYSEDQWRTTHPIEATIPSTSEATSNFDGITYAKGASSLKQLVFLMGEENFKAGLADYFKTYAEQNTIRKNFINALQNHTKENLNAWTKEWLQTKGLNSLSVESKCSGNSLDAITFKQGVVSGDKALRTHKLNLALWLQNDLQKPSEVHEVRISGASTLWKPSTNTSCPKAAFPNWGDQAYIQVNLDQTSLDFFSKNVDKVESKLMRAQFWAILKTMLLLGKFKPENVMALIKTHLPKEKDVDNVNSILSLTSIPKPLFYYYGDQKKALADRKELASLLKKLVPLSKETDVKKILFNNWAYNTYIDTPQELIKCLKTSCSFNIGFKLDIDRKWTLAKLLASTRQPQTQKLIEHLAKEDSSRRGDLSKLGAEVRLTKDKKAWLLKALDPNQELSLKKRTTVIGNLVPFYQRKENFDFIQTAFFENIEKLSKLPNRVQKTFAYAFTPLFCGDYKKNIPVTEEQIDGADWNFGVKKALLQSLDREERCLNIKVLSKSSN